VHKTPVEFSRIPRESGDTDNDRAFLRDESYAAQKQGKVARLVGAKIELKNEIAPARRSVLAFLQFRCWQCESSRFDSRKGSSNGDSNPRLITSRE
jgi:hypothetical protein